MHFSVLDLFSIGIGPSSSHTVGPMRAAEQFIRRISELPNRQELAEISCIFYGSLAATGKGHATDNATILGLTGQIPENIAIEQAQNTISLINSTHHLPLPWGDLLPFDPAKNLNFSNTNPLPLHPNGMHILAVDKKNSILLEEIYYSTGGGFIATESELKNPKYCSTQSVPFLFNNAQELINLCTENNLDIAELTLENEYAFRPENEILTRLDAIWETMQECVARGLRSKGTLPGGLNVPRRAHSMHQALLQRGERVLKDPLTILDWVNLYALAVNEENAAGGRVVTAPTNGAAGIIPAVLHYATRFCHSPHPNAIHRFLLVAGTIGILYKKNASISGADVGCQGEVGVACSMAAAALTDFLGGSNAQIENAAEIGMEHNLGLTCDPINGLVQIPCIERNAMASVKAINAARMALSGDGSHFVSLDKVIRTMRETGHDMMSKYKETSRGGLAVNLVEC